MNQSLFKVVYIKIEGVGVCEAEKKGQAPVFQLQTAYTKFILSPSVVNWLYWIQKTVVHANNIYGD